MNLKQTLKNLKQTLKSIVYRSSALTRIDKDIAYFRSKSIYQRDPKKAANKAYKHFFGHDINWDSPKDLVEKIFWLQFNTDTTLWTTCADKYAVRQYLSNKGLDKYLVKCYGCWKDAMDIDFDKLPQKFVLKTNNASETVIIVKDKSHMDLVKVRKKLNDWLKRPYGYYAAQTHYLRIPPCIIAEELLEQNDIEQKLSPHSLIDYKIWCFNGKVDFVWIAYDRTQENVKMAIYDHEWNPISNALLDNEHYINVGDDFPKPACWDEMVNIAEKLSAPFPELRVDLYVIDGKPYFGEMTFTTGYGYFTHKFYERLGDKVILPK